MDQALFDYLDAPCDRRGTKCYKWDAPEYKNFPEGIIPLTVADMDFPTAPEVSDALVKRASHPLYGYSIYDELAPAETAWLKRRCGLEIKPEWILFSGGVVDSLYFCVRTLTKPSDKVLILTPLYGPFFGAIKAGERTLVDCPLINNGDGDWQVNWEQMEAEFANGVKLFLLCNPHNPIGKLWTVEELDRMLELANRYNVRVVADEIHAEFAMDGLKTNRILARPNSEKCVALTSATKSFNIAGVRHSSIIVPDEETRKQIAHEQSLVCAGSPNLFGAVATQAAYTYGDRWMDAVIEYIQGNRDYTVEFIRSHIPEIVCYPQQGTYLMWLDFRALNLEQSALKKLLMEKAHIDLVDGLAFGENGNGFFRFNLATQRANIETALRNIEHALHD